MTQGKSILLLFILIVLWISMVLQSQTIGRLLVKGRALDDLASQNFYRMGGKDAMDMLDVITDTSKGWFINLVLIPIHPAETWEGETTWPRVSHEYFDSTHLRPFIERATELGLYVLIDLHYVHNSNGKDKLGQYVDERIRDFWEFIATRYSRYENLIRNHASNIIWVGAPCWSQQIGGSADTMVAVPAYIVSLKATCKDEEKTGVLHNETQKDKVLFFPNPVNRDNLLYFSGEAFFQRSRSTTIWDSGFL